MSMFLITVGIILCLIPCFMNGGDMAGNLCIVGTIIFVFGLIGRVLSKTVKQARLTAFATYNKETQTLNVSRRGNGIRNLVTIREAKNYTTKETPVKVHYGSATVGGVTTGGVYTTGGETVFTGSYSTGKYELDYIETEIGTGALTQDKKQYKIIYKICLTPELAAQAQNSNISKYLASGNIIQVVSSSQMSIDELRFAMNNLNSAAAQNMAKRGYPSQAKCQEILNWLSTE